jgi:predicted transcriptional regulator
MIRGLKERILGRRQAAPSSLGPLESCVMDVVWGAGESSVREVCARLARPLAYTTVMTTLDRLYKKGLLTRRKADRAFLYTPRLSRPEWERRRAGSLLAGFLAQEAAPRDLILSCFVDAVGQHDAALLDELERMVREKRKEMARREEP